MLQLLLYKGLLLNNGGYYQKYKTIFLEKNQYNFLLLGSSRAESHYSTKIIDSTLHVNSFNLSAAGASSEFSYRLLKVYLKKSNAPKCVIYELDIMNVGNFEREIKDFNNFFPFLYTNDFYEDFSIIEPRYKLFKHIPYYALPFCGLKNISTSIHGYLNIPNKFDTCYYKGFVSYHHKLSKDSDIIKKNIFISNYTELYLDSIISICKKNNIQLIAVTSPIYKGGSIEFLNKNNIIDVIHQKFKKNGVQYFNFSETSFSNNRYLFSDIYHLMPEGSILFTKQLCDSLIIKNYNQ
ncbi:MAG: hypothetical protein JSU07_13610 [Bacteroidetes bacterium]|nr:hypothetical protein [Bacteroidota bacterium]